MYFICFLKSLLVFWKLLNVCFKVEKVTTFWCTNCMVGVKENQDKKKRLYQWFIRLFQVTSYLKLENNFKACCHIFFTKSRL